MTTEFSVLAFIAIAFLLGYFVGRSSRDSSSTMPSPDRSVTHPNQRGNRGDDKSKAHPLTTPDDTTESTSTVMSSITPAALSYKGIVYSPAPIVRLPQSTSVTGALHKQLSALDLSTIEIQRTPEFDKAIGLIESKSPCVFVTGEAGTGKSTLLKYFAANTKKRIVVLAPTGVAALNVGGQTIHSFFQFPPGPINNIEELPRKGELLRSLDSVVIDEISMVRADLLDAVDKSLRINRGQPLKPFGGVQMIFFGDLFQLPPVVTQTEEGQFFSQYYGSPYFFDAHVFEALEIALIKLTTIYRQSDVLFMEILNHLRVKRIHDHHLLALNRRVIPNFEPPPSEGYIVLTTTNRRADDKNIRELEKLPLPETAYQASVEGEFSEKQYPTDYRIRLRQGAQVMFLNNDMGRRWVNGTIGIVEKVSDNSVFVRIPTPLGQPDRICEVGRHTWNISRYRINHTTRALESELIGSFTQFPLRLAWAITIHKSQGKTLDKAIIDFSGGTFAHGQAYVALSRCSTLEGMVLKTQIRKQDIIVDMRVFRFIEQLAQQQARVK